MAREAKVYVGVTSVWGQGCWIRPHPIFVTAGTLQCSYWWINHYTLCIWLFWWSWQSCVILYPQWWNYQHWFDDLWCWHGQKWERCPKLFLESSCKGPGRFPNVLIILHCHTYTYKPLRDGVLRGHMDVSDGVASFEVHLNAHFTTHFKLLFNPLVKGTTNIY